MPDLSVLPFGASTLVEAAAILVLALLLLRLLFAVVAWLAFPRRRRLGTPV